MLLRLAPTSRALRIETDDERVAGYVHTAYGNNLAQSTLPATDSALLLTRHKTGAASFNDVPLTRDWFVTPNQWKSNLYIVDQFVWRSLIADPDWIALYGCAVVVGERALLLVGASGVGKTTLAFALQRIGAHVIGDEMIVIRRADLAVGAIDRRLSIRWEPGYRIGDERLDRLVREHASSVGTAAGFRALDRRVFGEVPELAQLSATFVVTRGSEERVTPLPASRAALMSASHLGSRPETIEAIVEFARLLSHGRCFSLRLGQPDASARAVLEAFERC